MTPYHSEFSKVLEAFSRSSSVAVISHRNPDGDTLGASLALCRYFEASGKRAVPFCLDKPHHSYMFLPGVAQVVNDPDIFKQERFDTIIIVDCDLRYSGVEEVIRGLNHPFTLIQIDHHFTNDRAGHINLVVPDAPSTTTIIHDFFSYANFPMDKTTALHLLTGIIYDTDGFHNPATNYHALHASAELVNQGAQISTIVRSILHNKSLQTLKLWGRALTRLKKDEKTGLATTLITTEDLDELSLSDDSTSGISNFLNCLGDASAILIFKERKDGFIKGSLRTTNDLVDVSEFAKIYGGGGHKKSAGFTIKGRIEETPEGWNIVA